MATNTLEILLKVSGAGKASAEIKKLDGTLSKVGGTAGATGGKFNQLKDGLTSTYGSMLRMAGVATGVIASMVGIGVAVKKLGDGYMNYAFQVQDAARLSGATAEEMSKLIQVADDARVSVEGLTRGMWMLSQRGISPTVENIGKLADEYNTLAAGTERNTWLMEKFGRSGREMAKILELGSAKIQEMGKSVEGTARLMTEEGINSAVAYYAAMDALSDATTDLKLALGQALLPVIKAAAAGMTQWAKTIIASVEGIKILNDALADGVITQDEWTQIIIATAKAQIAYNSIIDTTVNALTEETTETEKATGATNRLKDALEAQGFTAEEINKILGETSDALSGVSGEAGKASNSLEKYQRAVERAANAQKIIDLKFAFSFPDITDQIGKYFDEKKWREAGGKAVEAAFQAIKDKMAEGLDPAALAAAETQLQRLAAAAEAIKVALGEQTRWDAIENLKNSLGLTWDQAKKLYDEIKKLMKGGTGNPWKISLLLQWKSAVPSPTSYDSQAILRQMELQYNVDLNGNGIIGKQYGGPVSAGRPYLVGERGPEMFIPNSAGRVINNQTTNQLIGGAKTTTIENEFNIYPPQIVDVRQLARLVTREQNRTAAR